ncbi:MAG: aminopeptidase P family protein [Deltaproteobacteria bacterium]|nr:aminopeptidase P family protein [Deltaproteobacteria bacterium]
MLKTETYRERRSKLRAALKDGVVLWLGNALQPRTYPANTYPFRQNSHFLYYAGLSDPDLAVLSWVQEERDVLFATPLTIDDIIWDGPLPTGEERAVRAGIAETAPLADLASTLEDLRGKGVTVHYVAPFQADAIARMAGLLGMEPSAVAGGESLPLKRTVVDHRLHKSEEEVAEIEDALEVTSRMYSAAMGVTRPGLLEMQVAGAMQGVALASDRRQCFEPIVTVRGQILHNETYGGTLEEGQLLMMDSGAESPSGYASDITRVAPVSGAFTAKQRDIYDIVHAMQAGAIKAARPGITNLELHLGAARTCARGLVDLGLMRGDPDAAVEAGAHAMFFPHGLGHVMGLDVHDMEDLGDIVGYGEGVERSTQFGLGFLRMARELEPGYVFTVEPGIYFVPALIDKWRSGGLHADFIVYDRVEEFRTFGGIRIEDDILVTQDGHRILGPHIPRTADEVEAATGSLA